MKIRQEMTKWQQLQTEKVFMSIAILVFTKYFDQIPLDDVGTVSNNLKPGRQNVPVQEEPQQPLLGVP